MSMLPVAKKQFGQHWLADPISLTAMCDAVDVKSGDTVLEIGPGTGTLTRYLLERGARVVAVEFDHELAMTLTDRLAIEQISNLEVIEADILQFDLRKLPAHYKVVANIPYYLTSHVLRVLCESVNPPSHMALLMQKEVAERVNAPAGAKGLLSVSVQYYCDVRLGIEVPARLFVPPPKVDSQILILDVLAQPRFPTVDTKQFFRMVKAGFSNRRKTLLNTLSGGMQLTKVQVQELLEAAELKANMRAQELSLKQWFAVYEQLRRLS